MKKKYAKPIFPNAGVEAWYRGVLQEIVRKMSQDMLDMVRGAWREGGGIAHDSAPPHQAAGIIFRDPEARILLLNRTDGTGWAYPGGGIEPSETPQQAATRECREEMAYTVADPLQWLHIREWRNVRFATFLCEVPGEFSPVLNDEHHSHLWVTAETALRDLQMHPGARETLEEMVGNWIATDAKRKPTTSLLMQRALHKWGRKWNGRLELMSMKIAQDFAAKNKHATEAAMRRQFKEAGFTVKFKPNAMVRQAYDAVVAENVGLIRSIPQKYLADVQNVVWQGVMQGSDLDSIANQLQDKYGIAHRRAALIARDQNHKAKAAIERAQRLDAGVSRARWKHSHAGKDPRPTHVQMDGESYEIVKGMWDKAVQKFIWPGTEINCRCTDEPEIPGFSI